MFAEGAAPEFFHDFIRAFTLAAILPDADHGLDALTACCLGCRLLQAQEGLRPGALIAGQCRHCSQSRGLFATIALPTSKRVLSKPLSCRAQ